MTDANRNLAQHRRTPRPAAACLDDAQLAAIVASDGSGPSLQSALEHVAECEACRELLACVGQVRAAEAATSDDPATKPAALADSKATGQASGGETRASTEASTDFRPGATLGRYELLKEIGRGGMGVVYEAHDPKLDRRVAVKVLLAGRDTETMARMAREAKAVAALSHPNVVQIFDVSLTASTAYLVMEFLEGPTLQEWTRSHDPTTWRQVLRAYIGAGRGLAAAHRAGLVHRDFKPANAIVGKKGHVKVLDFGLARTEGVPLPTLVGPPDALGMSDTESTLTATGIATGTPHYMAPEQHRGERADARADIYGFGIALYEALYKVRPFAGKSMDMLYLAKRVGLGALPQSPVPEEIGQAIQRALAFDPSERWPSMDELVALLARHAKERRANLAWFIPGAALIGTAAFVVAIDGSPGKASSTDVSNATLGPAAAANVDAALAQEAEGLVTTAGELGRNADGPRGLGLAYAALSIAAASGSPVAAARAQIQLGGSLVDVRQYAMAVPELRQGVELARDAGDDAGAADGAVRLIYTLGMLDQPDEALEAGQMARALARRSGDSGELLIRILGNEAVALPRNRGAESIERLEQALAIRQRTPALNDPLSIAQLKTHIANKLLQTDPDRAQQLLTEALAIETEVGGADGTGALTTALQLLWLDNGAGRLRTCVDRGAALYSTIPIAESGLRGDVAQAVAICYVKLNDPDAGLVWVERALDLPEAVRGGTQYANRLEVKGLLLGRRGEYALGEEALQQALVITESLSEGPDRGVATRYSNLAGHVAQAGDRERAEAYYRRAIVELEACGEAEFGELLAVRSRFARLLLAQERFEDAADLVREHAALAAEHSPRAAPAILNYGKGVYARALWNLGTDPRDRAQAVRLGQDALLVLDAAEDETFSEHAEELRTWIQEREPPA